MPIRRLSLSALAALALAGPVTADGRRDHFDGRAAATVGEAFENLRQANARLETLLAEEALEAHQLHEVHELTCTMDNAMTRLSHALDETQDSLEIVHRASEKVDEATVREQGSRYLEQVRQFVP